MLCGILCDQRVFYKDKKVIVSFKSNFLGSPPAPCAISFPLVSPHPQDPQDPHYNINDFTSLALLPLPFIPHQARIQGEGGGTGARAPSLAKKILERGLGEKFIRETKNYFSASVHSLNKSGTPFG